MDGSPAQLVKEKLNLVEVLKGYIQLTPAGRNYKALCPFHGEKSPSFMVSPERGTWHCFGCNEGGDVFSFVMKYENLEFGEVLKILAEKAGVELRRMNPMEYKHFGLLYDINAAAKDFFRSELPKFPPAKAYLAERGLKDETIETFEIGWAPQGSDALGRHLVNAGFDPQDIIRAGLLVKSDRGTNFDRFRGRIMFPIANHAGKTVGFTGRIFPQFDTGEMGKYVNSPETPIYQKSKILYGFSVTKHAIRETSTALMVEGQMDFLMVWQSGVRNVIATSGTALTAEHLTSLRRVADNLILSFDSDQAGLNALERAIDLAEQQDFGVKVAVVKGAKDPADAVMADPEAAKKMMAEAVPAPQFYFDRYLPDGVADMKDRGYVLKLRKVAAKLGMMTSSVEREIWLKELAKRTGLSEEALRSEAEAARRAEPAKEEFRSAPVSAAPAKDRNRREVLTERLLGGLSAAGDFTPAEDVVLYMPQPYPDIFSLLQSGARTAGDPELDERLNLILLAGESLPEEEIEALKNSLRKEHIKDRRYALSLLIKEAEREGNEEKLSGAMKELSELPNA